MIINVFLHTFEMLMKTAKFIMKKQLIIFLLFIFCSTIVFAQKEETKANPFKYSVSFRTDAFLLKHKSQEQRIGANTYVLEKNVIYKYPMFSIQLALQKTLSKRVDLGLSSGVSAIFDNRRYASTRVQKHLIFMPVSLFVSYALNKRRRKVQSFVSGYAGYTFFKTDAGIPGIFEDYLRGRENYGLSYGIKFRKSKQFKNYLFSVAYNYTKIKAQYVDIDPYWTNSSNVLDYKINMPSFSLAVQYQFQHKKSNKK